MFELYVLLALCLIFLYKYLQNERDYWKIRNVPSADGKLLFGNLGSSLLMTKSMAQIYDDIYKQFDGYKYCGVLNFRQPAVLIRDIDLVRDVIVKDFNKFHDNLIEVDEKADPILANNPFFTKGDKWKQTRAQVSPQFTAGKVKKMFPLIADVCKKLQYYLENEPEAVGNPGLNGKELASKFTADNIASCAFGLDGRSFVDKDAEFRKMGNKIMNASFLDWILVFLQFVAPELRKIKAVSFLAPDTTEWFKSVIINTIKDREQRQIKRDDFLDVIREMKSKTSDLEFTSDVMVAHCLTFFLDGFETSAVALQYALFELGANPEVQRHLKEECEAVLAKHDGQLTYEALQEMQYLDMVFSETLRKYPPLLFMSRICTETTTFPPATLKGSEVLIEKGVGIMIPVNSIHYDPQYYPDPQRFDPYRFTEEAKAARPKQSFLGFGDGPRICLGQRFATTQLKAAIAAVVTEFEIRVNDKTIVPLQLDPKEFIHASKGGIWLNFYKRQRSS